MRSAGLYPAEDRLRLPSGREVHGAVVTSRVEDLPPMPWDHRESARAVARHLAFRLGAGGLMLRRRRARGIFTAHLELPEPVDRFREVYRSHVWVEAEGQQSLSGAGSELAATRTLVARLPELLAGLGCETLLDIGCGDWHWMRNVALPCAYIGVDIVPEVVEANRGYERAGVEFRVGDAVTGPLPRADVILCREVLFHLSFRDGMAALANIWQAGTWLLATSDTRVWFNADIRTGDHRPVNLERAPYRLPPPRAVIEDEDVSRGRMLGLWATADLKTRTTSR